MNHTGGTEPERRRRAAGNVTGRYFLAGWSPSEPTSALPAGLFSISRLKLAVFQIFVSVLHRTELRWTPGAHYQPCNGEAPVPELCQNPIR